MTKPKAEPNSDNMLYELRIVRKKLEDLDYTKPEDFVLLTEFLERFKELDEYLAKNGKFPFQWITKADQHQLKIHEVTAGYSYADPDRHPLGMATCGHREYARGYCKEISCSNYVQNHLAD